MSFNQIFGLCYACCREGCAAVLMHPLRDTASSAPPGAGQCDNSCSGKCGGQGDAKMGSLGKFSALLSAIQLVHLDLEH